MSDIALSFLALLPRLILGFLILHLFWDSKRPQDLFLKITLAGAVGFGVSSLLGFLWLWAGLPLKIYAWIETGIALGLAFRTAKREITGSVFQSPAGIFSNKRHALWGVTVSGVFLLAGADAFLWGIQNPYGRTDAWLNWNVVSRFIFRGGDQWMRTFQRPFDHPDYPFLAPLSNAVTWSLLDSETIRAPMVFGITITFLAALLFVAVVSASRDFEQACLAGLVLAATPFFFEQGPAQMADMPIAYYVLASGSLVYLSLKMKEARLAMVSGFLAGCAAWTKNEGLYFVVCCAALLGIFIPRYGSSTMKLFLAGLAFPLAVIVAFKVYLAPSNDLFSGGQDMIQQLLDLSRYKLIAAEYLLHFWNLGGAIVSAPAVLLAYSFIVGFSKDPTNGIGLVGYLVVSLMAGFFVIYLITPHDLWWFMQTNIQRLYLQAYPLALFWLFALLRSPRELFSMTAEN